MKYFILLSLIFAPIFSFAQAILPPGYEEEVILKITPEIPAPKQNVSARVENYSTDLSKSVIVWKLDGSVKSQGVGLVNYNFTAPDSGGKTNLSVEIQKPAGAGVLSKSLNIAPAGLDLIYEGETYTPPFYKGRSLFSHQSILNVVAMPDFYENGIKIPSDKIIYNWEKDDEFIQSISGQGKSSAKFEGKLISRPFTITVVAQSPNSNIKARRKITINPIKPSVVMYENNPLYGSVFEKALNTTFNLNREELGITAIPYFFSSRDRSASNIKYSWFENGNLVSDETFGSNINYTNIGRAKSGSSNLTVKAENIQNILQSNNASFKVNVFGNEQSDTIQTNETNVF